MFVATTAEVRAAREGQPLVLPGFEMLKRCEMLTEWLKEHHPAPPPSKKASAKALMEAKEKEKEAASAKKGLSRRGSMRRMGGGDDTMHRIASSVHIQNVGESADAKPKKPPVYTWPLARLEPEALRALVVRRRFFVEHSFAHWG